MGLSLIPGWDLGNHHSDGLQTNVEGDHVVASSCHDIETGMAVELWYGNRRNAEWLLYGGFVPDGENLYDYIELELSFSHEKQDPYARIREMVFKTNNVRSSIRLTATSVELSALEIQLMTKDELAVCLRQGLEIGKTGRARERAQVDFKTLIERHSLALEKVLLHDDSTTNKKMHLMVRRLVNSELALLQKHVGA